MSREYQREYLVRLPLPLAQLYSRSYNAKDGRSRHDNCFYLFEALIKFVACSLIAAYADSLRSGDKREEKLDGPLSQLALPSLGHWVSIVREMARHFGSRPDAGSHPMGHLWDELNTKRSDMTEMAALFRRIKNGPDGKPAGDKSCSVLQIFEAIVQYRNVVFGHGANRDESFYESEMGPLLFPAINDLLAEKTLHVLGRDGSRLVSVGEIKKVGDELLEVGLLELIGLRSERAAPVTLTDDRAKGLSTGALALVWPGRPDPVPLDPLMFFHEDELADDVLILNKDRNGKQVEYLSYSTGRVERHDSMAPALASLLATITGKRIDEERLLELQQTDDSEDALEGFSTSSLEQSVEQIMGDYELLVEIGRGGMGVVYLARQISLGRLVALKMLPTAFMGDDVALARFRREVRALGRCDHPNIVKVISSGTMPTGQLYYTMEFVPGANLEQTWLEIATGSDNSVSDLSASDFGQAVLTASRKARDSISESRSKWRTSGDEESEDSILDLESPLPSVTELTTASRAHDETYVRRILILMRDVADALQEVHDQGVVHRDVKPSNLVLTPDGSRVVLMDFGLATGRDATAVTKAGGFVGTLRYCVPEQLAAASVQVGPSADVRGLGVTMWELLTRQKLFADANDEAQLSRRIFEEEVPLLRTFDRKFDPDLEAIVARSTERNTSDRIQSAGQLRDLIDLHLAEKPLPIRTPGSSELLWRWVRSHKALVTTSATALLTVIVTVAVAFFMITKSRDEEHLARLAAEKAEEETKQALDETTKARAEALTNFSEARDVVETSLLEVSEVLQHFPRMQDVRQRLLERAAEDFSRFASQKSDDPYLQEQSAQARIQLGDVQLRVRQLEKAVESYQAAEGLLLNLDDDLEKEVSDELGVISARQGLAQAYSLLGDVEASEKAHHGALSVVNQLLQQNPNDTDLRKTRAKTLMGFAGTLIDSGRLKEAIEHAQTAITEFRKIDASNKGTVEHEIASALNLLSQVYFDLGENSNAFTQAEAAIVAWTPLVDANPDEPDYLEGRASARILLMASLQAQGHEAQQIEAIESAIVDYEALYSALPDIPTYRLELAIALLDLAQIFNRQGRNAEAKVKAASALSLLRDLMDEDPQSREYITEAAAAQTTLARIQGELADFETALTDFDEAMARYDVLVEAFPDVPRYREDRAVCRSNRGLILHHLKDTDAAKNDFKESIKELEEIIVAYKENDLQPPSYLMDAQAHMWSHLGNVYQETGPPIEATRCYVECFELREQLTHEVSYACNLCSFLTLCPDTQFRDADRALKLAQATQKKSPDEPRVLLMCALAHYRKGNWQEAIQFAESVQKARLAPDCRDGFVMAMALWQSGEEFRDKANQSFDQASEVLKEFRPGHMTSKRIHDEVSKLLGQ